MRKFYFLFIATLTWAASVGTGKAQPHVTLKFLGTVIGDTASALRLSNPLGMSVDLEGNIYIADTGNHRVLKCDTRGKLLREVGGFGFGPQQFDRPVDVWAANGLDVFVADYNNQRVQRYDRDLNFISSYGSDERLEESLRFGYPAALALSVQGELFIADHEFNRVLRFDSFGVPKASFGDYNWGEGGLERPAKIFISRRNEVWVSDSLRHAVLIYDMFGNFVRRLDLEANTAPSGIVEWSHGMIIADSRGQTLLFYGAEGEFLGAFGGRSNTSREFTHPCALALLRVINTKGDKNLARLLVLDSGKHCVQLFEAQYRP